MKDAVKKEFVRRVLQDESQRFLKNQTGEIQNRLQSRTGRLLSERQVIVTSDKENNASLEFIHPVYERFLDLKRTFNRRFSMVKSKRTSRLVRRYQPGYLMKKSARIHNRFIFGHYYSIASRLMYEFTEETAAGIRKELGSTTINIDL